MRLDQPGPGISPTLWGVFFEDINFAGDGGLHAELVKNRSFEFPDAWMGWTHSGEGAASWQVATETPIHANNPHFLRLTAGVAPAGGPEGIVGGKNRETEVVWLENSGFRGMGVQEGADYVFRVFARRGARGPSGVSSKRPSSPILRVRLLGPGGQVLGATTVTGIGDSWQEYSGRLRSRGTEAQARLRVDVEDLGRDSGGLDLDMISLYPEDTWKRRPRGLRADLVQLLADLHPGFVRFPGGCIVEGKVLETRYQWKTTLGAPEQRKLIVNRWNDEFRHRPTPDYYQSFGLGFFEFFQLCDDLGAAPLPILNCGMACQFNSGELADLGALDPYIQDALDLVEFANGPASSPWGSRRVAMGHPRPFGLRFLGVGNEQWGPQYVERYARFAKALKSRYPDLQLIASAGPGPEDDKFHYLWPRMRELGADIIDEHCYAPAEWFLNQSRRYDRYDRGGPKVFMGEYAVQSVRTGSPENRNTWGCALAEAAYLTGLERNADVVTLSSYAPLMAHVDAWQWTPNLIWFDNLRSFGTPSYHVQRLFARNRGETVAPLEWSGASTRWYASAVRDRRGGELVLKVVNATARDEEVEIEVAGARRVGPRLRLTTLSSPRLDDVNSLSEPDRVAPREAVAAAAGPVFRQRFAANSLTILRLGAR